MPLRGTGANEESTRRRSSSLICWAPPPLRGVGTIGVWALREPTTTASYCPLRRRRAVCLVFYHIGTSLERPPCPRSRNLTPLVTESSDREGASGETPGPSHSYARPSQFLRILHPVPLSSHPAIQHHVVTETMYIVCFKNT